MDHWNSLQIKESQFLLLSLCQQRQMSTLYKQGCACKVKGERKMSIIIMQNCLVFFSDLLHAFSHELCCVFKEWVTVRFWHSWSEVSGTHSLTGVPMTSTRSWRTAGTRLLNNVQHLTISFTCLMTLLLRHKTDMPKLNCNNFKYNYTILYIYQKGEKLRTWWSLRLPILQSYKAGNKYNFTVKP